MKQRYSGKDGFTLIELLVAMAVTATLLLLLVSVASGSLRNFRQIDETVRMQADASAALNMIASDLEALAVEIRPIEVLESDPETVRGAQACWLMGLSRVYDNPGAAKPEGCGELRSFSYKMGYQDPVSGAGGSFPVYALYRKVLPAGATINAVLAAMLSDPSKGLAQAYWSGQATTATDDFLVGNVVRFDVAWTYVTTGGGGAAVTNTVPSGTAVRYRKDEVTAGTQDIPAKMTKATITLTLLPDSAVKQLNGAQPSATYLTEKGRSFTREVRFGAP